MKGNTSRDTKPELSVRRLLHARGYRYRVNTRPVGEVRRTADIVFPRARTAVLIDGCYWHGCPEHYTVPKANADFWREKVERNKARDLETAELWTSRGWTVLRFWTHQGADEIADAVGAAIDRTRSR